LLVKKRKFTVVDRGAGTLEEAIREIASMRPNYVSTRRGRIEYGLGRAASWCIGTGGLALLVVMAAALAYKTWTPSETLKLVALVAAVATQLLGVFGLLLQTIGGLTSIFQLPKNEADERHAEFLYDAAYVARLMRYPKAALIQADSWFDARGKRFSRRNSLFFGGVDRLALVALIGAGWAASKEVIAFAGTYPHVATALTVGAAFLAGLALGGVSVVRAVHRIAYQREIVAQAMLAMEADASNSPLLQLSANAPAV
jgi:hypothetical protein